MYYLNEVKLDNGPLTIVEGSHKKSEMLNLYENHKISPFTGTHRSEAFSKLIEELAGKNELKLQSMTSPGDGTGCIFNTRTLHRGLPITKKEGTRYAITFYIEKVNKTSVLNRRIKAGKIIN